MPTCLSFNNQQKKLYQVLKNSDNELIEYSETISDSTNNDKSSEVKKNIIDDNSIRRHRRDFNNNDNDFNNGNKIKQSKRSSTNENSIAVSTIL